MSVVKDIKIKNSTGTYDTRDIGAEAQYINVSRDASGNIEVYASIYYPDDPKSKLEAIETEKEWKVIETILETLQEEVRNKKSEMEDSEE